MLFVVSGGMFAVFFFATLYVQRSCTSRPVQAGLGFLPLTAAIIGASALAQQLIARIRGAHSRARRHDDRRVGLCCCRAPRRTAHTSPTSSRASS